MLSNMRMRGIAAGAASRCLTNTGWGTQALAELPSASLTRSIFSGGAHSAARRVPLIHGGHVRSFSTEAMGKKPLKHSEAEKATIVEGAAKEMPASKKTIRSGPGGQFQGIQLPFFGAVDEELWCISAAVAVFLAYDFYLRRQGDVGEEITMQELMYELVAKGHVERIQIMSNKTCGRVLLRGDAPAEYAGREIYIELGAPEVFEAKFEQFQADAGIRHLDYVPIQYVREMPMLPPLLVLAPLLLYIASGTWKGLRVGGSGRSGRNISSIVKSLSAGRKAFPLTLKVTTSLLLMVTASLSSVE
mmetsp:Transcript_65965/g.121730  ORF Transcript_65965/g.121730 Transcript_65965/m.121730 type:complete len:303 (-) Transcript_65965:125-1033(-)